MTLVFIVIIIIFVCLFFVLSLAFAAVEEKVDFLFFFPEEIWFFLSLGFVEKSVTDFGSHLHLLISVLFAGIMPKYILNELFTPCNSN